MTSAMLQGRRTRTAQGAQPVGLGGAITRSRPRRGWGAVAGHSGNTDGVLGRHDRSPAGQIGDRSLPQAAGHRRAALARRRSQVARREPVACEAPLAPRVHGMPPFRTRREGSRERRAHKWVRKGLLMQIDGQGIIIWRRRGGARGSRSPARPVSTLAVASSNVERRPRARSPLRTRDGADPPGRI